MTRLAHPSGARRLWALLVAVLLLPACSGVGPRPFLNKTPDPPLVKVVTVQKGSVPQVLTFTGVLRARRRASVSAGTSGVVLRVAARDGDRVTMGQPVIWLDDSGLQSRMREQEAAVSVAQARIPELAMNVSHSESKVRAAIRQARESLQQAQIQVQSTRTQFASDRTDRVRMEGLYKEKAVPRHQVEQAQLKCKLTQDQLSTALSKLRAAQDNLRLQEAAWHDTEALRAQLEGARASMRQAQAALESTRVALTQMVIRAPMTGLVVDRAVEPGQSVGAGSTPLLAVVDNSRLECASNVDQRFAPQVHRAMPAMLRTPLDPRAALVGTVTDVIPAGDPKTRTVRIRLEIDNHENRLMDGVSVNGRITLREHAGVLLPRRALRRAGPRPYVRVVVGQTAHERAVEVSYENETWYVVRHGLSQGDLVVTEGGELDGNTTVRVELAPTPTPTPSPSPSAPRPR